MQTTLKKAYYLFEKVTPLHHMDCGRLCEQSCCKGDDNTGMGLFPFEAEILKDIKDFMFKDSRNNHGYPVLVCRQSCERRSRPLACRIFPLFPLVRYNEEEKLEVKVIYDPRAKQVCPLIMDNTRLDPRFVTAVRRTGKLLIQAPESLDYLLKVSEDIIELMALEDMLKNTKA